MVCTFSINLMSGVISSYVRYCDDGLHLVIDRHGWPIDSSSTHTLRWAYLVFNRRDQELCDLVAESSFVLCKKVHFPTVWTMAKLS